MPRYKRTSPAEQPPSIAEACALIAQRGLDAKLVSRAFDLREQEWREANGSLPEQPVQPGDIVKQRPTDAQPLTDGEREVIVRRFRIFTDRLPNLADPDDVAALNRMTNGRWSA